MRKSEIERLRKYGVKIGEWVKRHENELSDEEINYLQQFSNLIPEMVNVLKDDMAMIKGFINQRENKNV